MAGKDPMDSTPTSREVPQYSIFRKEEKLRIAYLKEAMDNNSVDPEIREHMQRLIDRLRSEGHMVESVSFPYLEYLVPTYYVLTTAEASSNLSRFDPKRSIRRCMCSRISGSTLLLSMASFR